ncbi:MAG: hypothetical protein VX325_00425 [Bacteroidota bacterium]|nr:hypothetical protein [Bacteroidota bacterium]
MKNIILIICFFVTSGYFSFFEVNLLTSESNEKLVKLQNLNKPIVLYENGFIHIKDIRGPGKIEVYTIIGNKILDVNVQNFLNSKIPILLKNQNMYIIRIQTEKEVHTFKIVA